MEGIGMNRVSDTRFRRFVFGELLIRSILEVTGL